MDETHRVTTIIANLKKRGIHLTPKQVSMLMQAPAPLKVKEVTKMLRGTTLKSGWAQYIADAVNASRPTKREATIPAIEQRIVKTPEQQWKEDLAAKFAALDRISPTNPRVIESTAEHHQKIRWGIIKAIEQAPAGRPAVVLGAGALRDIPDELFTSSKFPEVYLVDVNQDAMDSAIKARGLANLLEQGRVHLLVADLSMFKVDIIREVTATINQAKNVPDLEHLLGRLVQKHENRATEMHLPQSCNPHQFGLVISSTLLHNMVSSIVIGVRAQISRKFRNQEERTNLGPWQTEIEETHMEVMEKLSSRDGIICVANAIADVYEKWLRHIGLSPEETAAFFKKLSTRSPSFRDSPAAMIFSNVLMESMSGEKTPIDFATTDKTHFLSVGGKWGNAMEIVSQQLWPWIDDPSGDNVKIIQMLIMRPFQTSGSDLGTSQAAGMLEVCL